MQMNNPQTQSQMETIVLVHGLWMHGLFFTWLARQLKKHGYDVQLYSYHSLLRTPVENAWRLAELIEKINTPVVHLVGHSLGGIIILHLLDKVANLKPGRIVLLGSPVKGSQVAVNAVRIPLLGKLLLGRSVYQGLLGGVPKFSGQRELGVIVGTKPFGVGHLFARFGGLNDGTVFTRETRIDNARDTVELAVTHTSMVFSKKVVLQIACFLERARFS